MYATLTAEAISCDHRHLAAVSEQLLDAKARFGRRDREAALAAEKAAFVERVNADLAARLEACEAEALQREAAAAREARLCCFARHIKSA